MAKRLWNCAAGLALVACVALPLKIVGLVVKVVQLSRQCCFVGLREGALSHFEVLVSVGVDFFAQARGQVDLGPAACRLDSCQMARAPIALATIDVTVVHGHLP